MTWRGSSSVSDRIFGALPYLLPLIDSLAFGSFLFNQFPPLQLLLIPLVPLLQIYRGIPFAGLIIFFALFLLVVRNEKISHFIRFNTMQAILIDIILMLCGLVFPILFEAVQVNLLIETLSNVIFLGVLAVFFYTVVQSFLGRYAEIPTISDAAYMQVR